MSVSFPAFTEKSVDVQCDHNRSLAELQIPKTASSQPFCARLQAGCPTLNKKFPLLPPEGPKHPSTGMPGVLFQNPCSDWLHPKRTGAYVDPAMLLFHLLNRDLNGLNSI